MIAREIIMNKAIEALKQVDWNYGFKTGLEYSKGKARYDIAMRLLRELPQDVAYDLFNEHCKALYTSKTGGYKNPFKGE